MIQKLYGDVVLRQLLRPENPVAEGFQCFPAGIVLVQQDAGHSRPLSAQRFPELFGKFVRQRGFPVGDDGDIGIFKAVLQQPYRFLQRPFKIGAAIEKCSAARRISAVW